MDEIPAVEVKTELPHSSMTVMDGAGEGVRLDKNGKVKVPRVRLHCSDGIYEEYSTDEEDDEEQPLIDPSSLTWMPYLWHYSKMMASKSLSACDFLGEKFAYMLGITSPKYEYIIESAKRELEEKEKEESEERRAEEEFVMETLSRQPASIVVENENVSPI